LVFVETIQPTQLPTQTKTFFGYRDTNDDAKACPVNIPIPNFHKALEEKTTIITKQEKELVITHITKGKCSYDPD